jgi:hypothetical protein
MQLLTPILTGVKPGDSIEECTWSDTILTKDLYLKGATGFQSATGHHIVIYYTMVPQPAGTSRACKDEDTAGFRYAIGAGGEGEHVVLPGQLINKIPAGAQIVVNHHWLNASTKTVDAQAAINLDLVEPSGSYVEAGALALVDTGMRIHPGMQSLDINCTLQRDYQIWQVTPHMHAYGTHIVLNHGDTKVVEVNNWTDEFTFHPPNLNFDPSTPMLLKNGDKMSVHCDWNNTTSGDLTFGLEMCVGFFLTINPDSLPNIACDQGQWDDF